MKPGHDHIVRRSRLGAGCGVLAISAQPIDAPPVATLPVSFISEKDFTQMTKGVKNAPQLKIPDLKPLADKVDAEKSVDQLAPKVADKPAITTDIAQSKPEPKPDQARSEAGGQARQAEAARIQAGSDRRSSEEGRAPRIRRSSRRQVGAAKGEELAEIRRQSGRAAARQARSAASDRVRRYDQ